MRSLPIPLVALAALLGLFAACSSAPRGALGAGGQIVVRLYDVRDDLLLEMGTVSDADRLELASAELPDATRKHAAASVVDALVADLDDLGFSSLAEAGGPPLDARSLRGYVSVERGGAARTFVVPADGAGVDRLKAWVDMKLKVHEYYASIGSLQHVQNPDGDALFRKAPR